VVTLNYRLGNLGFFSPTRIWTMMPANFALDGIQQAKALAFGLKKKQYRRVWWEPQQCDPVWRVPPRATADEPYRLGPDDKRKNLFQRAIVQSELYAPFNNPKVLRRPGVQQIARLAGAA